MRDFSAGPDGLSINTATVRKQWRLDRIIDECARREIRAIAPWRDQVAAVGLAAVLSMGGAAPDAKEVAMLMKRPRKGMGALSPRAGKRDLI